MKWLYERANHCDKLNFDYLSFYSSNAPHDVHFFVLSNIPFMSCNYRLQG